MLINYIHIHVHKGENTVFTKILCCFRFFKLFVYFRLSLGRGGGGGVGGGGGLEGGAGGGVEVRGLIMSCCVLNYGL
jgi:hypothetical protein